MNIIARILNFSIMLGLPVGLGLVLARKFKTAWRLFGIGVLTFILSQLFHIPFNHWVLNPLIEKQGFILTAGGLQLAVVGILYGLSAGLFEETARYLGYRFWIKDERDWKSALMFGAGHGGIESIALGILVLIGFVQVMTLRGTDLNAIFDGDQVETVRAQIEAYWTVPWHLAILGAVERLASIPVHLSATVLVLLSFRRRNPLWLVLAVGWHTIVDAVAVYAVRTWNAYVTEGIILVAGILGLLVIFGLRSEDEIEVEAIHEVEPTVVEVQPYTPSEENLEDSRYV
jgi:uncharacterized membrane protein YhfC